MLLIGTTAQPEYFNPFNVTYVLELFEFIYQTTKSWYYIFHKSTFGSIQVISDFTSSLIITSII